MASGNGYIQYLLHLVAAQGALASIYTDPGDPDGFFAGFLESVGPRHFLMAEVTPWGRLDGWRVRRTQDAFQILLGEEYEARLQILMKHYGEKHEALFAVPPPDEEDILFAVLEKCRRENRVISLVVGDDMITGRVTEVNQLRLKLAALSFLGADAGMEQLTLREIDMVSIDSQEERMYETLEQLSGVPKLRVLRERAPGREEDHED
jgi:hypothetical protein